MESKAITFLDIFNLKEEKVDFIEIPIIQRDYAQGRKTKSVQRIRERFLNVLYDALTEKTDPVQLDFIYGSVVDKKFIPLDGQQRLTTLFLLHWYIAKHEDIDQSEYPLLNNFTYKTRFSSEHFCEKLVKSNPDFSKNTLSEWLTDQNWFLYSWEKDPTVDSMLTMLDSIHERFKNTSGLWQKLKENKISFYYLPLKEMGLTDSLYIKMNSRGKPLTNFEHFKADFEKIIKEVSTSLYEEFIHKADIDWVDMLWKYDEESCDVPDDKFMRYYRFITEMICFENDIQVLENDFDLAAVVYGLKNENAERNLKFLFNAFDCWKDLGSIDGFFENIFSKEDYEKDKVCLFEDEINLFSQCCLFYGEVEKNRRQFTLNNTLLLYSVLNYLLNKEHITEEEFRVRIRIVRNLISNSADEVRMDRIKMLLAESRKIILDKEINLSTLGFNELQKEEEIKKIEWRLANPILIDELNRLEDHKLLQGSIAIIGLENTNEFKERVIKFFTLFNGDIDYLLISSALLTIGDYSQLIRWRFILGNKNDSTWRELFLRSKNRKGFDETKDTLYKLLRIIPVSNTEEFLEKLCKEFLNNPETPKSWRYYFVKYPTMRHGTSGVYWWRGHTNGIKTEPYNIIMMNTAFSTSGKHWDPFLYTLYETSDSKEDLDLEEYNAPLIFNQKNIKVRNTNSAWEIYDLTDQLIQKITIPQENGIDLINRIELFKNEFNKL